MASTNFGIDAEVQAFIERTNSFYPPDTIDFTIEQQRQVYNEMCIAFHAGYPEGITTTDDQIDGPNGSIPIRRYTPDTDKEKAVIAYYHGGGFMVGGLESHDDVCSELSKNTGHKVVSVDYRMAPEYPYPFPFQDALASYEALLKEGRPVVVAGDSAGGNLSAAICAATQGQDKAPIGQLLIYPGLGGSHLNLPSYTKYADAPLLTTRDIAFYRTIINGEHPPENEPTLEPLSLKNYKNLPPCAIFAAGVDPLCDDSKVWHQRLMEAGIASMYFHEEGLPHGYLRARHMSEKARNSFKRICEMAEKLGNQEPLL